MTDASTTAPESKRARKEIRVWVDGVFDVNHWGHANALRQAKALGDYLIVGVHNDEEVRRCKGPPVFNEQERYEAVRSVKWVDEVVPDAPYTTSLEMVRKYNCDFVVHGDDVAVDPNGNDAYEEVKKANMFRTVPRTIGVSTTDIVGRMLLLTKNHFLSQPNGDESPLSGMADALENVRAMGEKARVSHFLPTSKRIVQFSNAKEPKPDDKVVYCDGAFDLFHVGHIRFLERARALGDYLIIGVYDDKTVNGYKGANFPVMNLHERVLSVLACKHVDEVIIGAPLDLSSQILDDLRISFVAHGSESPMAVTEAHYAEARRRGLLRVIQSDSDITTTVVLERIIRNRMEFLERQKKKDKHETHIGNWQDDDSASDVTATSASTTQAPDQ